MKKIKWFLIGFWLIGVLLPTICFSFVLIQGKSLLLFTQWTLVIMLLFYGSIGWLTKT